MYVVTGATGNTGGVVARTLLEKGEKVRVIGRSADRLKPLTQKGAEAAVVDIADPDASALTQAFSGAKTAYLMIPPDPRSADVLAYQGLVTKALVTAVQTAAVEHVVVLSSYGADKTEGTGPVVGLHRLEEALNQISALNALYIRAGYFMENIMPQVNVVKTFGVIAGPLRSDLKLPMIATHDIGAYAASAMLKLNFEGKQARELHGQRDITYTEVAKLVGSAIGKPNLQYMQMPDAQLKPALMQMGMSENFVDLLLEMARALNSGHMRAIEPRTAENTTPTSIETFVAEEFVPAYDGKKARVAS